MPMSMMARSGKERLIVIDLGVTFSDMDSTSGVDLIFPTSRGVERRNRLRQSLSPMHTKITWAPWGIYGLNWGHPCLRAPFRALARMKMEDNGHSPAM